MMPKGRPVGRVSVTVNVRPDDLKALGEMVKAEAAREARWRGARLDLIPKSGLTSRERAEELRRVRTERAAYRASDDLMGTLDLLLAWGLRVELARRGWDRRSWKAAPAGAAGAPGRPWGRESDETLTGRLAVRLPADLVDTARRASYWVSAPAIEHLMAWRDKWGPSLTTRLRQAERAGVPEQLATMAALSQRFPSEDDLRARDEWRAQVVTFGDIVRNALMHTLQREFPPDTDMGPALVVDADGEATRG